ncbi:MAG: peroxiredoxin [Rhodocyclaceae bacterium]
MPGGLESALGRAAPPASGGLAPVFALPDANMHMFDLAEVTPSRIVVLYFYPRDSMPSSLRQAIEFSDADDVFARCGAVAVGVSLDDCVVHADFCDRHGLSVTLLSDPEGEACRLYGVWQEREVGGRMKPDVQRATFIIGRDGYIHHVIDDWSRSGHTAQVLELVQELARSRNGNRQEHRRHA